jgi:predicted nucleic acid-binding protein
MRVLLDTSVILDSVLQRVPWHVEADEILRAAAAGRVSCAAVSLSMTTLFYVARRLAGANQARTAVRTCLSAFEILTVDVQTLLDADALPGSDFEDNVQIAAAVQCKVDAIVTRDTSGFAASPLPVFLPADLLKHLPP